MRTKSTAPELFVGVMQSPQGPLPHPIVKCNPDNSKFYLPRGMGQLERVIYGIYDNATKMWYVGKSEAKLAGRISVHNTSITKAQDLFHREVGKRPNDFYFCVLKKNIDKHQLSSEETSLVAQYNAFSNGYNGNRGGGGGGSKKNCFSPKTALQKEKLNENDLKDTTPDKYYPFNGETMQFDITATGRKKRNVVYAIKQKKPTDEESRYVGSTGTTLVERMYKLRHKIVRPEIGTSDMHKEMRKNPNQFSLGILHECVDPKSLPGMETSFIRAKPYTLRKDGGFNGSAGSNGPAAESVARKISFGGF